MIKTVVKGIKLEGNVYKIHEPFPLMGHLFFGIIDRGFNIVQARVSSLCGLSCVFCSVDAGAVSRRIYNFLVISPEWMARWIERVVGYKGEETDVLFDASGDPITNPLLPEFVRAVREIKGVRWIVLETRLHGVSEKLIEDLAEAGLTRINLSIDTFNEEKARALVGTSSYSVEKVKKLAELAFHEYGIDIHVTPLWIPGVNDDDLKEIILWALNNGFGKEVPPLGIQKYVVHPHGRKVEGVAPPSWREWRTFLQSLESMFKISLVLKADDYRIRHSKQLLPPIKKGDEVWALIVGEGPYRGEFLAVTKDYSWSLTVLGRRETLELGDLALIEIIRDKDGILIGKPA